MQTSKYQISLKLNRLIYDDTQLDKQANNQADKQANEQANKRPDKQSKAGKELSERENAFFPIDITRNNGQVHRNVTGQDHFSSDPFETCSANNVACYQAIRASERLWNASDLVFGSFHQNDVRFSEHSRGYQCTCNALCMLSYAQCHDVDNSLISDKVLCEGDALYQTVIRKLKSDGKFVQQLLSLEEIPDDFEVEIGKFTLEKFPIVCGPLVDTQDIGLPTLHNTLQSAFLSVSSGLLTIGAICSAVFKKHGLYAFFDSHCHGENGLSATDGASSLITFASLNDLLTYMYAFYDSLKLDSSLHFDFLPINVKKSQNKQRCEDKMASHMEAYFIDQRLRQATKTQSEGRPISIDLSSISTEKSKEALGAKRKKLRNEYYKIYRRKCRQNLAFKEKERKSKQSERRKSISRPNKLCIRRNQSSLHEETPLLKQKKANQSNLKEEIFFSKQKKLCIRRNQSSLHEENPPLKQKKTNQSNLKEESFFSKPKKLCIRRNQSSLHEETPPLKQKKTNQSNLKEEILYSKPKKLCIRRNQCSLHEETPSLKQKKTNQSNLKEEILFSKPKKLCI